MNLVADAIKGTQDLLPKQAYKWQYIEKKTNQVAKQFDFKQIRTPVFEKTELFQRGVGDTTDVVQKEMYTFDDKGGRSITLRPEGTAGAMRSILEHGLFNEALPIKAFYNTSCYRYEKPQAGRLREFHQFGVECIGAPAPSADAEVIILADTILKELGIKNISLEINSIGCPECRAKYTQALKEYFSNYTDTLCETCNSRLERNPMRILDCKSPVCKGITKDAPVILDYLCEECSEHFEKVKSYLDSAQIEYIINPQIVRGLDYYTKTVFEFITTEIGAQGAVCAGGRYDGLAEELGGPKLPSLGFAMGIERILILMEKQGCEFPEDSVPEIYIAPMGEKATEYAIKLCKDIRESGYVVVTDYSGRGLKAQMKYANKIGAKYSIVIGDNEIENKTATLKDMINSKTFDVSLPDGIVETIFKERVAKSLEKIDATWFGINKGEDQ